MEFKDVYLSKPWLDKYPKGVPHEVEVPEISVPELFDQMADKHSHREALIFYGKKIKYKELKELTDRFAAALADLGVKHIEMPLTPERVWLVIQEAQGGQN